LGRLPVGGEHEAAVAKELLDRSLHPHRLVDLPVLGQVAVTLEPLPAYLAFQRCLTEIMEEHVSIEEM